MRVWLMALDKISWAMGFAGPTLVASRRSNYLDPSSLFMQGCRRYRRDLSSTDPKHMHAQQQMHERPWQQTLVSLCCNVVQGGSLSPAMSTGLRMGCSTELLAIRSA